MRTFPAIIVALIFAAIAAGTAFWFFPINDYMTSRENLPYFVGVFAVVLVIEAIAFEISKEELHYWLFVRRRR